jgi:hypothetical protein
VDIRVLFAILVLSTAAVVAVVLAVHFRVKRHLREEKVTAPAPQNGVTGSVPGPQTPSADDDQPKHTSL